VSLHTLARINARTRELALLGAIQGVFVGAGATAAILILREGSLPVAVCIVALLWLASYVVSIVKCTCDVPFDFGSRFLALIKLIGAYATLASALSDEWERAFIWVPIACYLALGARVEYLFTRIVELERQPSGRQKE
jgi:hypothetical protein